MAVRRRVEPAKCASRRRTACGPAIALRSFMRSIPTAALALTVFATSAACSDVVHVPATLRASIETRAKAISPMSSARRPLFEAFPGNAFDDYDAAIAEVEERGLSAYSYPDSAEAWSDASDATRAFARRPAARRVAERVVRGAARTHTVSPLFHDVGPEVFKRGTVAKVAWLVALQAQADGAVADAARIHLALIRFGQDCAHGGGVMTALIGVAIEKRGLEGLRHVLGDDRLTAAERREIAGRLDILVASQQRAEVAARDAAVADALMWMTADGQDVSDLPDMDSDDILTTIRNAARMIELADRSSDRALRFPAIARTICAVSAEDTATCAGYAELVKETSARARELHAAAAVARMSAEVFR